MNSNKSLADVKKEFPEIINYQSFQKKNIFNNNHRININNIGNDYWESGISRPDIVLQDLIRIFHPELSKDNTLYYYTKLE